MKGGVGMRRAKGSVRWFNKVAVHVRMSFFCDGLTKLVAETESEMAVF